MSTISLVGGALARDQAPALAILHATSFSSAERWSATVIALQLGAPGGFGFVDSRGGMILCRTIADEAEVLTLAVAPAARRQGIGADLLRTAMPYAARLGGRCMFLEVSVTNFPAIGLYRQLGFEAVGERRRYYADGTDALVMRARLVVPQGASQGALPLDP